RRAPGVGCVMLGLPKFIEGISALAQFNWTCPFCNHAAVITDASSHEFETRFSKGNKYGLQLITGNVAICPNDDCGEYALLLATYDVNVNAAGQLYGHKQRRSWRLVPESMAKTFPNYIPDSLIE